MREKLVCYLLGELDEAERAALEARLANEPHLRKELEQIRACLGNASDCGPGEGGPGEGRTGEGRPDSGRPERAFSDDAFADDECPDDLAARTVQCISRALCGARDGVDPPAQESRFTFVDMCVACGVLLALGCMLLPALPRSRELTRREVCADNMRQLGQALIRYADNNGGRFPFIQPNENAGMFAVRLVDSGELSQADLQRMLWCRASGLQEQLDNNNSQLVIVAPTREQLEQAKGQALAMLRRWMAGSYAYRLGYVENGRYLPIKNHDSSRSPILSDAPTLTSSGWVSLNHGPHGGQNVLHQDGYVRFQVSRECPTIDSNVFVNYSGRPAAGEGPSDVVLARSDMTPGLPLGVRTLRPVALTQPAR